MFLYAIINLIEGDFMKLVEATCNNCGANLQFDEQKDYVDCKYCNSRFIIARDKHELLDNKGEFVENYNAVAKTAFKAISIIWLVSFIFAFAFILFVFVGMFTSMGHMFP